MTPCPLLPPPSNRGLSWPLVIMTLALIFGAVALWGRLQEEARIAQVVVRVDGREITRRDLAEALRAYLWQRSEAWTKLPEDQQKQRREEALRGLMETKVLQSWLEQHPDPATAPQTHANTEAFQTFLKQFEEPGAWEKRAGWQHLNEAQLQAWIDDETHQREAVEAAVGEAAPKVTEAEAKAWLAANPAAMQIPERVQASHFFLGGHDREKPDRTAEIAEYHRRLTAGEITLGELVAEASEDSRSNKLGGNLGWFSRDRVPADFAEKVFALKVGELSAPIQSRLGWHIVLVHEKRAARAPKFEEVKTEVMALLQGCRRAEAATRFISGLTQTALVEYYPEHIAQVTPLQ